MAKAKVTITASNQMTQGIKGAQQDLLSFQKIAEQVGKTLKTAFSVTAIVAAGKALVSTSKEYIEAYKVQLEAETKLANALAATNKQYELSATSMKQYATQLQNTTRFGDEAIIEVQALLVATEKLNEEGLKKTVSLSADLAEAMGTDLKSAAQTLSKVLQDPTKGLDRLKQIGVSFTAQEKEQIQTLMDANEQFKAQDIILDKVKGKYGGLAEAIASTPTGKLDQIKNVLGDIKEDLGKGLVNSLAPAFDWILKMLQKIETWANQIAQKSEFRYSLNQGVAGNSNFLVKNFTAEYLRDEISKRNDIIFDEVAKLEENYWLNNYLKKGKVGLAAFLEMQQDDQIDLLMKLSNNDALFVSMIQEQLVEYNKAFEEINALNSAIAKQEADRQRSIDEYWASIRADAGSVSFSDISKVNLPKLSWEEELRRAVFRTSFGVPGPSPSYNITHGLVGTSLMAESLAKGVSEAVSDNLKDLVPESGKALKDFLSDFGTGVGKWAASLTGTKEVFQPTYDKDGNLTGYEQVTDKAGAFGAAVLSSVVSNLGEAGQVIGKLAQNMATMGPVLGAIATALEYVLQGIGEVLKPILDDIVRYGLEPLREFGRVFGENMLPLFQNIMPLVSKSAESLMTVFNGLGQVLGPIIEVISSSLTPVLDVLCNIIDALTPVFDVLARVIIGVTGTIQYVVQGLQHWVAVVFNWLAGLDLLGWKPFAGLRMTDPGNPGNYADFMADKYADYDARMASVSSWASNDVSTQTAVQSAQYRGATSVTINVYAEGPFVGDNGMRQFARMIRDEFDALNYYGVGA